MKFNFQTRYAKGTEWNCLREWLCLPWGTHMMVEEQETVIDLIKKELELE